MGLESIRYSAKVDGGKFILEIEGDQEILDKLVLQPLKVGSDIFHILVGTKSVKSVQFNYHSEKRRKK